VIDKCIYKHIEDTTPRNKHKWTQYKLFQSKGIDVDI